MGLHEGRGRLGKSLKELLERWGETRMSWDDSVSKNFEKTYLYPLEMDMRNAVGAMDEMSQLLSKIKRDCDSE